MWVMMRAASSPKLVRRRPYTVILLDEIERKPTRMFSTSSCRCWKTAG